MKRIIIAVLVLIMLLTGCNIYSKNSEGYLSNNGVWLSYFEIGDIMRSSRGLQSEIDDVIKNCRELDINNVYIHVRSHCDSIFSSKYFPLSEDAKIYDYDIFEFMISKFHENGIKVHAWINPYRVSTSTSDINEISVDSPAYKWLNDESLANDRNVCVENGIYLNPAESEVQSLIINGVREIVSNYDIDGIVFDDYFYPTVSDSFDKISYDTYKDNSKKPLSLGDWRRTNVNSLISGAYNAIKSLKKDVIFTVSPSHSVTKNYNEFYADVKFWIENGIVDVIMPQIYFGFDYPDSKFTFENLIKEWKKFIGTKTNVKLIVSLPSYKIGTSAAADTKEWNEKDDILARQAKFCYEDGQIEGFVFFSYSSLFSENELNSKQRNNLKDALKDFKLSENING